MNETQTQNISVSLATRYHYDNLSKASDMARKRIDCPIAKICTAEKRSNEKATKQLCLRFLHSSRHPTQLWAFILNKHFRFC